MNNVTKSAVVAAILAGATACASSPDKLGTQSVSPLIYKGLNCEQIALEAHRVDSRITELYASLKKTADNDAVQMGVGLVLFWPVLFALEGGDGVEAAEYSRLKGERDALNYVALEKQCSLQTAKGATDGATAASLSSRQTATRQLDVAGLDGNWELKMDCIKFTATGADLKFSAGRIGGQIASASGNFQLDGTVSEVGLIQGNLSGPTGPGKIKGVVTDWVNGNASGTATFTGSYSCPVGEWQARRLR